MRGSVDYLELGEHVSMKKSMTSESNRPRIRNVPEGATPESRAEHSRVQPVGPRSYQSQTEYPAGCGEGALELGLAT